MDNGQKTMGNGRKTKNKARSTKNVVTFRRGGRMEDEAFYRAMVVDENMPFYLGVLELLDRAEDDIWDRNRDAELSREARADLGLQAGVIREIRAQLVAAREYGVKAMVEG
jgi:hypothetical protein